MQTGPGEVRSEARGGIGGARLPNNLKAFAGRIVSHKVPLPTLGNVPIRKLGPTLGLTNTTSLNSLDLSRSRTDRAQHESELYVTRFPVHHGLASEAALHGSDRNWLSRGRGACFGELNIAL